MRTIIIHCHLFKNAGTTLDWSLARYFGSRFIAHTDDAAMRTGAAYLGPYLEEHETLCALSSHHVRLPLPELDGARLLPIFLLRHPIDRAGSVYLIEVRQDPNTPGAVNAKKMTFQEYVSWRMEPTVGATIRNFQVRSCCGRLVRATQPATREDYEAACRQLQRTPLLGVVERYDESMVLFEEALRPYYPDIDLSYVRQNVSKGRKGTPSERVEEIYRALGAETSARLREHNAWDQQLYEAANVMLSERIAALEGFEARLEAFRHRCRHLRAA